MDGRHPRATRRASFWQAYRRSQYAILFFTLLVTMLAMPIVEAQGLPGLMVRLLVGASLLAAVMPNATRRTRLVLFVAVCLLVVAMVVPERGLLALVPQYADASITLLGILAAGGTLRFALKKGDVSREMIFAALCTYILAGLFLGRVYWLIETHAPGSVVGPDPFSEINAEYFSFVTLATLGYGDFVPRTPITRGIAVFEVVAGQLFLAVMIARLVGGFSSKSD